VDVLITDQMTESFRVALSRLHFLLVRTIVVLAVVVIIIIVVVVVVAATAVALKLHVKDRFTSMPHTHCTLPHFAFTLLCRQFYLW